MDSSFRSFARLHQKKISRKHLSSIIKTNFNFSKITIEIKITIKCRAIFLHRNFVIELEVTITITITEGNLAPKHAMKIEEKII